MPKQKFQRPEKLQNFVMKVLQLSEILQIYRLPYKCKIRRKVSPSLKSLVAIGGTLQG